MTSVLHTLFYKDLINQDADWMLYASSVLAVSKVLKHEKAPHWLCPNGRLALKSTDQGTVEKVIRGVACWGRPQALP